MRIDCLNPAQQVLTHLLVNLRCIGPPRCRPTALALAQLLAPGRCLPIGCCLYAAQDHGDELVGQLCTAGLICLHNGGGHMQRGTGK
jgi:hypothetical protein